MSINEIGSISLNVSLLLYCVYYIPQDIRNLRESCLEHMSFWFHALLFVAATCDFYYGFGYIVQWQYRLVTIIIFTLLLIQHIQLYRLAYRYNRIVMIKRMHCLSVVIIILLLGLLPALLSPISMSVLFITMGWIERICTWGYAIPQIVKNAEQRNSSAISPLFLILAVLTAICDSISAFVFHWGPSTIYGAPVSVVLHLVLLFQYCHYKKLN